MSSFYARDFSREFDLRLILGRVDIKALWEHQQWEKFLGAIRGLLALASSEPSVEGVYIRSAGKMRKAVPFKSKIWQSMPADLGMFSMWKLYAPADIVCTRNECAPDVYVSVFNEASISTGDETFNPVVVLAVAKDIPNGAVAIDAVASEVVELTSAVLVAEKSRRWGMPTGIGYNEGINETQWFVGGYAGRPPASDILYEQWDRVIVKVPKGSS